MYQNITQYFIWIQKISYLKTWPSLINIAFFFLSELNSVFLPLCKDVLFKIWDWNWKENKSTKSRNKTHIMISLFFKNFISDSQFLWLIFRTFLLTYKFKIWNIYVFLWLIYKWNTVLITLISNRENGGRRNDLFSNGEISIRFDVYLLKK